MNQIQKQKILNKQLDLVAEYYLREMIRREYPEWIDYDEKSNNYYDSLLEIKNFEVN
ncbi:MAG: hypothetical protein ACRBDX_07885 [Gammaproteobacteria bacterium]